jgi:pectate lyase
MKKARHLRPKFQRILSKKQFYLPIASVLLLLLLTVQVTVNSVGGWSLFCTASQAASIELPAFPGAEGYGAATLGGRGGRVIEVTNLNDRGPRSLRAAIREQGARIVVFRVSGIIDLESSLEIRHPNITIAGQTSPGGITLRNSAKNGKSALQIKTHDVILQYLRSRPGPSPIDSGNVDALAIIGRPNPVYNIMIDHCSFSWATDEVVSTFYDVHDVTIQWSMITEGLDCSTHVENGQKQCHSMGLLLGSEGSRNVSVHHNLIAHNRRRNPLVKNSGVTDIVNNVIYNSGFGENSFAPTQVMGTYQSAQVNYVGNYFKPGVDTSTADWFIDTKDEPVQIYADHNQVARSLIHPGSKKWLVRARHKAPIITTTTAGVAYQQVLLAAGAAYRLTAAGHLVARRDAIDDRIVLAVQQRKGQIINDPAEVGGWVESPQARSIRDRDRDGMPDAYELQNQLNPKDATDAATDADADGYTNLEEYLNGTNPKSKVNVAC